MLQAQHRDLSICFVCAHTCVWELEASPPLSGLGCSVEVWAFSPWSWRVDVCFQPLAKAQVTLKCGFSSRGAPSESGILGSHGWCFGKSSSFFSVFRIKGGFPVCLDGPPWWGLASWVRVCWKNTAQSDCWTGFDAHTKIFNCVNSICFLSLLLSLPICKVMILWGPDRHLNMGWLFVPSFGNLWLS